MVNQLTMPYSNLFSYDPNELRSQGNILLITIRSQSFPSILTICGFQEGCWPSQKHKILCPKLASFIPKLLPKVRLLVRILQHMR
jgi:hypothetical protein